MIMMKIVRLRLMAIIIMIYDDSNDAHDGVDLLMYVADDHGYDGDDININYNDSCNNSSI